MSSAEASSIATTLKELLGRFAKWKGPRAPDSPRRQGGAVGEATLDLEVGHPSNQTELRGQPDSSQFAFPAGLEGNVDGASAHHTRPEPQSSTGVEALPERRANGSTASRPSGALAAGRSVSVRFADVPDDDGGEASPRRGNSRGDALTGGVPGEVSRQPRVRLMSPADAATPLPDADSPLLQTAASTLSATSACSTAVGCKGESESRALGRLVAQLISRDVNYRAHMESLMETFGPTIPKKCLESFLEQHGKGLSSGRRALIVAAYQVPDDPSKVDGLALLKDLDRTAFKRFATAGPSGSGGGGGGGAAGSGEAAGGGGGKKSSAAASVQMSDRSRIMTLVTTQLEQDKSFSISAGGGALSDAAHLHEAIEEMDLSNVVIPVGTRARYVPATDDPDSFQVPVWSLRAMHRRKAERERFLLGNDPDFRKLGQAGREALRKRLTRRSLFQQQEIIANAVVAAARAAVEPAARRAENCIQSCGPSRANSFAHSRAGSMARSASAAAVHPSGGGAADDPPAPSSASSQSPLRGSSLPRCISASTPLSPAPASRMRKMSSLGPGRASSAGMAAAAAAAAAAAYSAPGAAAAAATAAAGATDISAAGAATSAAAGDGAGGGSSDGGARRALARAGGGGSAAAAQQQQQGPTRALLGGGVAVGASGSLLVLPVVVAAQAPGPTARLPHDEALNAPPPTSQRHGGAQQLPAGQLGLQGQATSPPPPPLSLRPTLEITPHGHERSPERCPGQAEAQPRGGSPSGAGPKPAPARAPDHGDRSQSPAMAKATTEAEAGARSGSWSQAQGRGGHDAAPTGQWIGQAAAATAAEAEAGVTVSEVESLMPHRETADGDPGPRCQSPVAASVAAATEALFTTGVARTASGIGAGAAPGGGAAGAAVPSLQCAPLRSATSQPRAVASARPAASHCPADAGGGLDLGSGHPAPHARPQTAHARQSGAQRLFSARSGGGGAPAGRDGSVHGSQLDVLPGGHPHCTGDGT